MSMYSTATDSPRRPTWDSTAPAIRSASLRVVDGLPKPPLRTMSEFMNSSAPSFPCTSSGDSRPARPHLATTTAELLNLRGLHLPVRGLRPLRHQCGVGRRIGGHVRRAAAFELFPQDRHDLPTEDLDLLEHHLLR